MNCKLVSRLRPKSNKKKKKILVQIQSDGIVDFIFVDWPVEVLCRFDIFEREWLIEKNAELTIQSVVDNLLAPVSGYCFHIQSDNPLVFFRLVNSFFELLLEYCIKVGGFVEKFP